MGLSAFVLVLIEVQHYHTNAELKNSRLQNCTWQKMGAAVVSSVYHVMHFLNAIVTFYRCELIQILVSQTTFAFTFIG